MSDAPKGRWSVVLAGTGINLALGILYTWSIFKAKIADSIAKGGEGAFSWDVASLNDPYAVACLVFAFSMIVAGKVQDKFGPRLTAMLGGLMVGAGFILASTTTAYVPWLLGFGVLAGTGIGFGYSSATPPGLKWFPTRTGLVAGVVVAGFGLASVYIAPLSTYLLGVYGVQKSMLIFGIAFAIVVSLLSMMLVNPPLAAGTTAASVKAANADAIGPATMVKSGKFWVLWLIYFVGSGAGLMVIGSVAGMAKSALGDLAFVAVAIMAIGNAGGRIAAGMISDRIGRLPTLAIMLSFQAVLMFVAIPTVGSGGAVALVLLATFIGFNYGTNLALFPAITKDNWGLAKFGVNYGVLFTAWGVGGFVLGRLSEMLKASSGNFNLSFIIAGVGLVVAAGLTLALKAKTAK